MEKYPEYISKKRRPVEAPDSIVVDGVPQFGTFSTQFKKINLLDCKKPCGPVMPSCMKKGRLTEWEAFEVNMDEGSLISAVYNMMNLMGFSIMVWYDKAEDKVYSWQNICLPASKAKVAQQLIDDSCYLKDKNSEYLLENDLANGKAHCKCYSKNKQSGTFEMDMNVERVSPISNVCIPLGNTNPLYSEKDFFKATGYVVVNGKRYETKSNSTSIIDDHKGYYPYKSHYDWLTTMGTLNIDGEEKYFAFNLTRNQSTNPDDYNENLIWLEGWSSPLPPVNFTHDKDNKNIWYVKDEYGCVDIRFEINQIFQMPIHAGVISIDYDLPFGKIYGTLKDINGKVYCVDGMTGIGEDKSTRI